MVDFRLIASNTIGRILGRPVLIIPARILIIWSIISRVSKRQKNVSLVATRDRRCVLLQSPRHP